MAKTPQEKIKHVFVLMLENRSYDHMLGFSPRADLDGVFPGPDADPNIAAPDSDFWNLKLGDPSEKVFASTLAGYAMNKSPRHDFKGAYKQLTGQKWPNGKWGPITNKGFIDSSQANYPMKCFHPDKVPILHQLGEEFAVCDSWYSSMPGPTIPNRSFVHAGSASGMDYAPQGAEMGADIAGGIVFPNGTIFDRFWRMKKKDRPWWWIVKCAWGQPLEAPLALQLRGLHRWDITDFAGWQKKVKNDYPDHDRTYTFIEPSYDALGSYRGGNSQHPQGDVRDGERLIKRVYLTIRHSTIWKHSLLVITYDEHGGFYDHGCATHCPTASSTDRPAPPKAPKPKDNPPKRNNKYGFKFDRYGPRVPAVIVSPWIKRGRVASASPKATRQYDHTSVLRTLAKLWDIKPLTERDANAQGLLGLLEENRRPHEDTPTKRSLKKIPFDDPSDPIDRLDPDKIRPTPKSVARADDSEPMDDNMQALFTIDVREHLLRRRLAGKRGPARAEVERLIEELAPEVVEIVKRNFTRGKARAYAERIAREAHGTR